MRLILLPAIVLLGCCLASCSTARSSEDTAILAAARRYLATNSAPSVGETDLKIEEIAGTHARVSVTPVQPTADPAVMYLRRVAAQSWQGVTLGTGWSPDDFDQLHIPQDIRE